MTLGVEEEGWETLKYLRGGRCASSLLLLENMLAVGVDELIVEALARCQVYGSCKMLM